MHLRQTPEIARTTTTTAKLCEFSISIAHWRWAFPHSFCRCAIDNVAVRLNCNMWNGRNQCVPLLPFEQPNRKRDKNVTTQVISSDFWKNIRNDWRHLIENRQTYCLVFSLLFLLFIFIVYMAHKRQTTDACNRNLSSLTPKKTERKRCNFIWIDNFYWKQRDSPPQEGAIEENFSSFCRWFYSIFSVIFPGSGEHFHVFLLLLHSSHGWYCGLVWNRSRCIEIHNQMSWITDKPC